METRRVLVRETSPFITRPIDLTTLPPVPTLERRDLPSGEGPPRPQTA